MDAAEIIRRMCDVYASCSSYTDVGCVKSVMIHESPARRRTSLRPFRTAFVRPDRFRFEFRESTIGPEEEWDRYVILWMSGKTQSYWTVGDRREDPETLSMAVASAAGVSRGASITVPSMMLRAEFKKPVIDAAMLAVLEGEELIDDDLCAQVRLPNEHRERVIWVSQKTHLLRRIAEVHKITPQSVREAIDRAQPPSNEQASVILARARDLPTGGAFTVEATTDYTPAIDAPIDDDEFTLERRW